MENKTKKSKERLSITLSVLIAIGAVGCACKEDWLVFSLLMLLLVLNVVRHIIERKEVKSAATEPAKQSENAADDASEKEQVVAEENKVADTPSEAEDVKTESEEGNEETSL